MSSVTDPVCGMSLATVDTSLSADHAGATYYFCSSACQQRFRDDPHHYTAASPNADGQD